MNLYEVNLNKGGDNKLQTINVIHVLNECGLTYARCLVETAPATVAGGLSRQDAEYVCDILYILGNEATIQRERGGKGENKKISHGALCDAAKIDQRSFETFRDQKNGKKMSLAKKESRRTPAVAGQALKPAGSTRGTAVFLLWLGSISCCVVLLVAMAFLTVRDMAGKKNPEEPGTGSRRPTGQESSSPSKPPAPAEVKWEEGTVIEEFLREAFGKAPEDVTGEELDLVTSISYQDDSNDCNDCNNCKEFAYELSDGRSGRFITGKGEFDSDQLMGFRNLEVLDSNYVNLEENTLTALEKLHTLRCKPDLFCSLSRCVNPENIRSLGIFASNVADVDLSAFVNLEELTIRCSFRSSLESLEGLEHLKALRITDGSYIEDFAVLVKLTDLEELYIESGSLKSIQFVRKMPKLTSFGIEGTKVQDISDLAAFGDQLTELHLVNNYEIRDYSPVEGMTKLSALSLVVSTSENGKQLILPRGNAAGIRYLKIGGFDDCSGLERLENLECLILERNYDSNLEEIRSLPNLKEFHQHNTSVFPAQMENLLTCSKLENVCFEDGFLWEDLSVLLNKPGLESLNLSGAGFGLDPDKLQDNPSLEYLNLESARIYQLKEDGTWDYQNRNFFTFEEIQHAFSHYRGLKYLYVPGYDIRDLEFLADCRELEVLGIEDNYVTDLTPVKHLPLRLILCDDNPLYETAGLEDILIK